MKALSYLLAFLLAASAPAAFAKNKNGHHKKQGHSLVEKKHGKSAKHKAKKEKKRDTASVKSKKHKGKSKKKKH